MNRTLATRVSSGLALVCVLSVAGAPAAWAFQRPEVPKAATAATTPPMTDRIIVKYKDAGASGGPAQVALDRARAAGGRRGVALTHLRRTALQSDVMQLDRRLTLEQARTLAAELKAADASIEYAEPDRIVQAMLVPNDPLYTQQWSYFDATGGINLPTAWDRTQGAGVVVAVLDTGVRPHADLAPNLLAGHDFIVDTLISNDGTGRDADASDPGDAVAAGFCQIGSPAANSSWHGTHVAGTIAAATGNGAGVAGVAWGAKVLPVRILGRCGGYTSDMADGIVWSAGGAVSGVPANANPARVINLSLGGMGACDTTSQSAINAARARGAVVVVAAGNANVDAAQFSPASCTGVITVAATGLGGGKASYSNTGAVVAMAAPGGDGGSGILSTLNAGTTAPGADSYAAYMGTSMATPHVSGVVALMLSQNPTLTPDDVLTRLKASARPFPAPCALCGAGLLDAQAALVAAGTPPGVATVVEVESNNSTRTAQAIATTPVLVKGSLSATSDTDYFKLTVPAGGKVVARLSAGSTSNFDLYAYNSRLALTSTSRNGAGLVDAVTLSNTSTKAATVYVRVVYGSGAVGTSAGAYSLELSN